MVACATAALYGQFNPTVAGFVHDAAQRSLRPIVGIPGSAYIGSEVALEIDAAWPAPNSKWAIGVQNGRTVLLRGLKELQVLVEADSTLLTDPTQVAWNAEGTIAALYSANTHTLQTISVSAAAFYTSPAQEIGYLDSSFTAFSVSVSGEVAILGSETIYIIGNGKGPRRLSAALGAAAIAFWNDDVLYTAGPAGLLEYSIRTLDAEPQRIAATPDAVTGLRAAPKLDKVIVASAVDAKLYVYTPKAKTFSEVALDRPASHLNELQTGSMFLLNGGGSGQPAIVFDLKRGTGVFFVPELGEGTL
jgi:hypothetical protein